MSKTQVINGVERRRRFNDEEKANLVAEAMNSTMSAVARRHSISLSVLHIWKKKFPPKSFALVEVKATDPKAIETPIPQLSGIRVIIKSRIVVEFPLTADPSAIAIFIKALEG